MKNNTTKVLLFMTLCLLLIGIVSATDVESTEIPTTDTISESIDVAYTEPIVEENVIDNKQLEKKDLSNEENIKTDTKLQSKIAIDQLSSINIDDWALISGTVTDVNNNPIRYVPINIDVNGDAYETETSYYGDFFGEYVPDSPGQYTITVSFAGNSKFLPSTAKSTFKVVGQAETYIDLNTINDVTIGNNAVISGRYYYGYSTPLPYTTMRININGQQYLTKTDTNGYFTYNYKTTKTGTNTVTVSYPGNSNYKAASESTTFNVKNNVPQTTYITLNNINEVLLGNTVSITGRYYYGNNIPLPYTLMRLNINGQQYTTKTDSQGYYTYNYKTTKIGSNTVIVSYPGNTNYKAASINKTFNVKSNGPQTTYITVNNINEVSLGNSASITGRYYYGNNIPLPYTTMRLNINGQQYLTKTDSQGYFIYNYKTTKSGLNTVTVSYPGNTNYKAASITKTFNVKSNGPQTTYITVNNINEVSLGNSASITGRYYYGNNIPLPYTTMRLNINGQEYLTKTDSQGYFIYNYKTTKSGSNTVTVSYPGNTNYKAASVTKTFNVKYDGPKTTYIDLYYIDSVTLKDTATINGYYYYGQSNPLPYTTMRLNINGQEYLTKTDAYGYFTYNYKTSNAGTNTVTVSYPGNTNYKAASASDTFYVYKKDTIITLNNIETVYKGYDTTISGKYTDIDGYPLRATTITLGINGNYYHVKTDSDGYFYFNYYTNKVGTNTVTASYDGTSNYNGYTTSKTFTVLSNYEAVTFSLPKNSMVSKKIDGDIFVALYSTISKSQYGSGVFTEIDDRGNTEPPVNKIVYSTIYFKNSTGDIVTKTAYPLYNYSITETSLIPGYTPYKVEITYRKMTPEERNNYR